MWKLVRGEQAQRCRDQIGGCCKIHVSDVGNYGDGETAGFSKMARVGGSEGTLMGRMTSKFLLDEWPFPVSGLGPEGQ